MLPPPGTADGTMVTPYRPACSITVALCRDAHGAAEDDIAQVMLVVVDARGRHVSCDDCGGYANLPAVVPLQHRGRGKRAGGMT